MCVARPPGRLAVCKAANGSLTQVPHPKRALGLTTHAPGRGMSQNHVQERIYVLHVCQGGWRCAEWQVGHPVRPATPLHRGAPPRCPICPGWAPGLPMHTLRCRMPPNDAQTCINVCYVRQARRVVDGVWSGREAVWYGPNPTAHRPGESRPGASPRRPRHTCIHLHTARTPCPDIKQRVARPPGGWRGAE